MQKINDVTYEVKTGEKIIIDVVPTNFLASLPSVEAILDDEALDNIGTDDHPRFSFTVTKIPDDTHRVFMEFTFLPGTPDDACYVVTISGKNDVGCPCGFEICKADEDKEPVVAFDVVN